MDVKLVRSKHMLILVIPMMAIVDCAGLPQTVATRREICTAVPLLSRDESTLRYPFLGAG